MTQSEHTEATLMQWEFNLMLISGLFLGINFLALSIQNAWDLWHWIPFGIWIICAVVGTMLLRKHLPDHDPVFFPIVMLMTGWGIILIERLAPNFAERQTIWMIIAVTAMLFVAIVPQVLRWLRTYRYVILVSGFGLLISTILLGSNPSGIIGAPELWLGFGDIFFQPSEIIKIILVTFLASYLSEQYPILRTQEMMRRTEAQQAWLSPRILGPIILMWSLSIIVVIWQRDLGTAAIFFLVFLVLLYVASGQTFILIGGVGLLMVAGYIAYNLFSVVELRVDIWLNPWPESDGRAFQIVQSLMAFASGGIFGQGIGEGNPTYIPVVHSDFIFSAIGEEYGLVGIITVIALIASYVVRGLKIAIEHENRPFYGLLAIGFSLLIGLQSLLIMGGVLKVLPLTGVTLPFFSYGGSSLLTCFIVTGLLLRLSAETR